MPEKILTQQQGTRQNLIPEQFFNDPKATQRNAEGIRAVKVLKLAKKS